MSHYRIEKRYNKKEWELDKIEPTEELARKWLGLKKSLFIKLYDVPGTSPGKGTVKTYKLFEDDKNFRIELRDRTIEYKIVKKK